MKFNFYNMLEELEKQAKQEKQEKRIPEEETEQQAEEEPAKAELAKAEPIEEEIEQQAEEELSEEEEEPAEAEPAEAEEPEEEEEEEEEEKKELPKDENKPIGNNGEVPGDPFDDKEREIMAQAHQFIMGGGLQHVQDENLRNWIAFYINGLHKIINSLAGEYEKIIARQIQEEYNRVKNMLGLTDEQVKAAHQYAKEAGLKLEEAAHKLFANIKKRTRRKATKKRRKKTTRQKASKPSQLEELYRQIFKG